MHYIFIYKSFKCNNLVSIFSACCESFELYSNGSAIAAQKDSFTWYNNTGAELNGRPLYESLDGKSLMAYKSKKGWSVR